MLQNLQCVRSSTFRVSSQPMNTSFWPEGATDRALQSSPQQIEDHLVAHHSSPSIRRELLYCVNQPTAIGLQFGRLHQLPATSCITRDFSTMDEICCCPFCLHLCLSITQGPPFLFLWHNIIVKYSTRTSGASTRVHVKML